MNDKKDVFFSSDIGIRPQNEDEHIIIQNMNRRDNNIKFVNLYSVFDGHGGKLVSSFLKNHYAKYLLDKRCEYPLNSKYVLALHDMLQETLLKKHDFAHYSGSTALTVIHFLNGYDEYLNVINLGDSRCVLCRENFALPLTKDHKPNWPEESNRITKLGGVIKFDGDDFRIGDLSVSRAFGDIDTKPFIDHRPDLFRYKLDKNDKFIVIACDGLWDCLSDSDVINFVLKECYDLNFKRLNKNINIASRLGKLAIKKGSTDNVTVIVVFLH